MSEFKSYNKITVGSEKSFGIVFGLFFLIIFFYLLIMKQHINYWYIIISALFFFFTFFYSKIYFFPNKLWFKFGMVLGSIISPIVMGLVFFSSVLPIGIFMKVLGKDILNQKIIKSKKSYWNELPNNDKNFRRQF